MLPEEALPLDRGWRLPNAKPVEAAADIVLDRGRELLPIQSELPTLRP